jgi:hypothetical protein
MVPRLPPAPWPHKPPGDYWDPAVFGPEGTLWDFPSDALGALGESIGEKLLKVLVRKLGDPLIPEDASIQFWATPPNGYPPPVPRRSMRYVRLSVIGKLGTNEQVSHTFGLRTAPTVDVDQDAAAMQTLADQVRTLWATWFSSTMTNGQAVKSLFSPQLTYTEVRAAYVESTVTGTKNTLPITGHRPKIVYTYARPTYLVPTQYSLFAAGVTGTDTVSLPWEVALAMTLESGRRGAANRGRTYLGPFGTGILAGAGNFDPTKVQALATAFAGGVVHAINAGTGCDVHVVSKFWNDSIPVSSVRAGVVPDSQRRRRQAVPENYGASVATPLT